MRHILAVVAVAAALLAQPPLPTPCPDCTDPQRPWMRGHIEQYCGKTEAQLAKLRDAKPGATILKCDCHHVCNSADPVAGENGGRTWDAACEARCNPKNCTCMALCDSH